MVVLAKGAQDLTEGRKVHAGMIGELQTCFLHSRYVVTVERGIEGRDPRSVIDFGHCSPCLISSVKMARTMAVALA